MLAGEFTDLGSSGIEATIFSSMAWGDYDTDGDLDLVVSGATTQFAAVSKLYRNDGALGLTEVLPGFLDTVGDVTWADYDRDGSLDLFITGQKTDFSAYSSQLYHNNGNGTFSVVNGTGLDPINGQAAWGDYDNDGRIDVAINGFSSAQVPVSKIYHNDGNGQFSELNAGLPGLVFGSVSWGDANTDGRIDLLMTGTESQNVYRTKLYLNNGQGSFTDANTNLPAVTSGDTAWGDYDNDGDQDLLLSGGNNSTKLTQIYKNDGTGTFTSANAGLPSTVTGDANFGDYDNDGLLDVLLTGYRAIDTANFPIIDLIGTIEVFRNNGNDTFSPLGVAATGVDYSASAWGDYDNDGDIDFMAAGSDQTVVDYSNGKTTYRAFSSLFQNNANPHAPTSVNSLPGVPTPLSGVAENNGVDVTLTWSAPTDAETPTAGLSYNLRIGSTPGGSDFFSSMSDNGTRLLPAMGPVRGTSYTLKNVPSATTLYWSVQAIDTAFAGGAFSVEQSVTTPYRISFTDQAAVGLPALDFSSTAWGDSDNDGDLDLLVTGRDSSGTPIARLYRNDGNNSFSDANAGLTGVAAGSVAWGDADRDGDLDLLLTGQTQGGDRIAVVYRNNSNNSFTDIKAGLTGVAYGSVAWGDSDQDGDLDILLSGATLGASTTRLYQNNGNSTFTDLGAVGMPEVRDGAVAWGDYDADGDSDIILTGQTQGGSRIAKIFRNNGNNTFSDVKAALTGVKDSAVAWGDADNDGDLDVIISGQGQGGLLVAQVYRNDGSNTFSSLNAGLVPVSNGSVAWGDSDNDGDLDIVLTGQDKNGSHLARLYRNNGNNNFSNTPAALTGVAFGSVGWADADDDGDVDLLLTGQQDGSGVAVAKLYRSDAQLTNTPPAIPTSLAAKATSDTAVTFTWSAPTDSRTPSAGLSYNLRVGTTPGGSDIFSTMGSSSTGARLLPASGPIQGTSYTLMGLTPGATYYWSVQAVDSARDAGSFAAENAVNLIFTNTVPKITGAAVNQAVNDKATISPFAAITLIDPDTQSLYARVTIENGVYRGDFTPASIAGWNRTVVGNTIRYERYFSAAAHNDYLVQDAVRSFVFQPREGVPGATEATRFTVLFNDIYSSTSDSTTTVVSTATNDAPTLSGAIINQTVNDDTTILPFRTLKVTDPDTQNMLAKVTILNGVVRGDFTAASTTGWTRTVTGNNIIYSRYYKPETNIGGTVQAAIRGFVFQPRKNALNPGMTEKTAFEVFVNDGVVVATSLPISVITTSVNDAPKIDGAVANQAVNDNTTIAPFTTLNVIDADTQSMVAKVTILNGVVRGDFTAASTTGWTRSVTGNNIIYSRYYNPATNIGASVQAAIRAFVFQPRSNVLPVGQKETTAFTVFVNDGLANVMNSTTSVITTSVAPRPAFSTPVTAQLILASDITTVVLPSVHKPRTNSLARLLTKAR